MNFFFFFFFFLKWWFKTWELIFTHVLLKKSRHENTIFYIGVGACQMWLFFKKMWLNSTFELLPQEAPSIAKTISRNWQHWAGWISLILSAFFVFANYRKLGTLYECPQSKFQNQVDVIFSCFFGFPFFLAFSHSVFSASPLEPRHTVSGPISHCCFGELLGPTLLTFWATMAHAAQDCHLCRHHFLCQGVQ